MSDTRFAILLGKSVRNTRIAFGDLCERVAEATRHWTTDQFSAGYFGQTASVMVGDQLLHLSATYDRQVGNAVSLRAVS